MFTTFHTSYAARDENVDRTWRVGSISRAYAVRGFCNLVSLSTLYAVEVSVLDAAGRRGVRVRVGG